jgi:lipopolysaccharide export system protein LptA
MTMRTGSRLLSWFAALAIVACAAQAQESKAPPNARQGFSQNKDQPVNMQAQESKAPPNALQGFSQNKDQPVNIKSAALEVHDKDKMATFTGNVHLVQGDTTLRCKVLVVYYDADQSGGPAVKSTTPGPTGSSQIRKMLAKGSVIVVQKDQTAAGELGEYDTVANTVTLSSPGGGKVSVTQGPNILRSPRLVVHLDTGVSHFVGGVDAVFTPNSTKGDAKPAPATDANAASTPQPQPPKRPNPSGSRN